MPLRKSNRNAPKNIRLEQIAEIKARHDLEQRRAGDKKAQRLTRKEKKRKGETLDIVAYDLETTNIKAGTPRPLYITAYCDHKNYILSKKIDGIVGLFECLESEFLVSDFNKCQFVAWNANNYDVYFVALALLDSPKYVLRPYLTKNKALRGLRVIPVEDLELKPKQQRFWEFLDGISMLGLVGTTLKDFLKRFAPEYEKQERESFENAEFNPDDGSDVAYAFRDSEGLYFGMQAAQDIVFERFNTGLRPTIGNLGIKLFESRIPETVNIVEPQLALLDVLRNYVCRGGYCHLMRRYKGRVWKYDLNQAYAAAMRECRMPQGFAYHVNGPSKYAKTYIARVSATNPKNKIPFYCRETIEQSGATRVSFATTTIVDTWLTKMEIDQLTAENWSVTVHESWAWGETFDMSDYVNVLETLRVNAPGGPSGAVGTMIKAIGNNSYGKTLEQLEPLELVLSKSRPNGFTEYFGDGAEIVPLVWARFIDTPVKKYHQPQIGAYITAHVRMVIRRAALLEPDHFLYADTDCVIFSKDVTKRLDIDSRRYGAFKLEAADEDYLLIAKKVYMSDDFSTRHSKGLNVKKLNRDDFVNWFLGTIPEQTQVQRQNFVKFIKGSPMFVNRTRKGTAL